MTPRTRAGIGLAAGLAAGVGLGALLDPGGPAIAHEPELSRYAYWQDIRPLMERHCASCHAGEGPAPVNLMRYAEAIPWANSIARQVLERRMPPWLPDDGIGAFAHARTLDERETNMLVDWAIGLAPEGSAPGEPPAEQAAADPLPAARLSLVEPIRIGEEASEAAVCAELVRGEGVGNAAGGFALSGSGGAEAIRRRATLFVGDGCAEGVPVFTWVVGQGPRRRPEGAHDALPPDAGLFLAVDYRKGFDTEGYAFADDLEVAVFPPTPGEGSAVETVALEPGATRLGPATLLAILPPLDRATPSSSGDDVFAVDAVGADGEVTELLRIRRPDPDWTERFVLAEPLRLEAGASVRVSHPGAILDLVRPRQAAGDASR